MNRYTHVNREASAKMTVIRLLPAALAVGLIGACQSVHEAAPSANAVSSIASDDHAVPSSSTVMGQQRVLVTARGRNSNVMSRRSLDSGDIAVLVTENSPDQQADRPREQIVVCPVNCMSSRVLVRQETESFANWRVLSFVWEPGGTGLLVEGISPERQAWFRVDLASGSPRFELADPLIQSPEGMDPSRTAAVPVFDIHGNMRPMRYNKFVQPGFLRETDAQTHRDTPWMGGVMCDWPEYTHTAFVNRTTGHVAFMTGEKLDFAANLHGAVAGSILFFHWQGRALAARWTSTRYGTLVLPQVPGAFRTVDLGKDTLEVRPIAIRNSHTALVWIQDKDEGRLVEVAP